MNKFKLNFFRKGYPRILLVSVVVPIFYLIKYAYILGGISLKKFLTIFLINFSILFISGFFLRKWYHHQNNKSQKS